jgi:hypothetical protein
MNKTVTLNLPESVYNNLYQIAQQKGLSLDKLITEWLSNFNQKPQQSIADDPIFGLGENPIDDTKITDASTNHNKYLYS